MCIYIIINPLSKHATHFVDIPKLNPFGKPFKKNNRRVPRNWVATEEIWQSFDLRDSSQPQRQMQQDQQID